MARSSTSPSQRVQMLRRASSERGTESSESGLAADAAAAAAAAAAASEAAARQGGQDAWRRRSNLKKVDSLSSLKRFSHPRERRPQMLRRVSSERGVESAGAGAGAARQDGQDGRRCRSNLKKVDSLSSIASLRDIVAGQDPNHDSGSSLESRNGSSSEVLRSLSSARRSLSFTLVAAQPAATTWQCSGSQLPRTYTTFSLVQLSGARLVPDIIASLDCKMADRLLQGPSSDSPSLPTPEAECSALASCALDPYYRVIIASSGGLPSLVRAMTAFPESENVQASGCAALASVSLKNASNQSVLGREGALEAVLAAMRNFPLNVEVQSAACDALNNLTSLCDRNVSMLKATQDFEAIIVRALDRSLPSSCREGAEAVLQRTKAAAAAALAA